MNVSSRLAQRIDEVRSVLARAALEHAPCAFASSLSAEDMVLADLILRHRLPIEIFTLDTGRLHADTLALIDAVRDRYDYTIKVYTPKPEAVSQYVKQNGLDGFYRDPLLRKSCCAIRKVEPLERALKDQEAWITGQRREQSATRGELATQERDHARGIEKFNPLANWSEADVWEYVRAHQLPYNRLHDQGYRSIGCAPCSRPVLPDEDVRAGRWWWEESTQSECGLHVGPDGRLTRARGHA